MTKDEVQRAAELCKSAGCWLIMDNTYEQFVYNEQQQHHAVAGEHILHVFSFSKAYGMMGWRVGYIAYPEPAAGGQLGAELLKVGAEKGSKCRKGRGHLYSLLRKPKTSNRGQFVADMFDVLG
jgi:aspartate/methionine/tyrosine aminotransferase